MGSDVDITGILDGVVFQTSPTTPVPPEGSKIAKDMVLGVVPKNSSENSDYIPANGETLTIASISGAMPDADPTGSNNDIYAKYIWDPAGANTLVAIGRAVYSQIPVNEGFTGDGVKKFRVEVTNNSNVDIVLVVRWDGYETTP